MKRLFQIVPAGSSIIAMIPYRVVNMDMKKIMALAMMALMVIPSLTMTVGAVAEEDMACAIERAQIYLDKVRASAVATAAQYPFDENMQGYLDEINDLLGEAWKEDPDFLLEAGAVRSEDKSHRGTYSVHLETTGTPGDGDEARIVIPMPEGFTLGELETLSWWEYLVTGYPPHVDVILDLDDDGSYDDDDDALVFEYAYNTLDHYAEGGMPYNAQTEFWYKTFNDDEDGPSVITDTSMAWATKGAPGPPPDGDNFFFYSLADWKTGVTYTASGQSEKTINSDSIVLRLEIEVDNWVVHSEAYVDDIKIDGVTYDFEEEPDYLGAEGYLNRASACLAEGDFNSAARNLAAARNILGRVKGLLNRMAQAHKVTRIERFMEQVEHRIKGIVDKVERLRGRFGEGKANSAKASMGLALGNMPQLGDNPTGDEVNEAIDKLESTIASINEALDEMDEDTLEAMDRLEAKIRVLKASAERLSKKGYDTAAIVNELNEADELLNGILDSLEDGDMEEAESLLKQAGDLVSEASNNIRRIRNQDKDSNGKGK